MRLAVILLVLGFWSVLTFRALRRGDVARAGVYVVIGLSLAAYLLR
jgi:hypothetical protein